MNNKQENDKISALIEDLLDEVLDLDADDLAIPDALLSEYESRRIKTLDNKNYYKNLLNLQAQLIKLQDWVVTTGAKILVICEGRDSAGKGGVIKRITQRMDPRVARVVALPKPTERELSQWYFQRYVPHLPAKGEMVLFDRSWYNRAGVERVMGFASENEVEQFFQDVTEFERMLVRSGIILLKYWFSITDEEQQFRFKMRIHDPMKQWKLSDMDLQSRIRWEQYTKAKEEMFDRTSTEIAPWYIVEGNDKRRERLNCMAHILSKVPYDEVPHKIIELPERVFNPDYERRTLPDSLYIPKIF
ncbi:MAG: polyphosphate kinase 2 [Proteobacteria bacterium]|nr:polyphosphate kinase 2 [Pseudomonadota bacterium]